MQWSYHTIIVKDYPLAGEHLAYNTRSQALVKIHLPLKEALDSQDSSKQQAFDREIRILHEQGIVVQDHDEDMKRLYDHMHQVKFAVNTKTLFITILTTYACNFKCDYCFEESSRVNEKMTPEVADATMNWIKQKMMEHQYQSLFINFYGGEPLLNVPIMTQIASSLHAWCQQHQKPFRFMMQTNGYLMNKPLIEKLKEWGLSQVRISVDGVEEDHDRHRPLRGGGKTFNKIMQNIQDCCDLLPIGLSVSFDKSDVSHIERLLNYCEERGLLKKLGRFIFSPIHATLGPKGEAHKIQHAHCASNYDNEELILSNQKIHDLMKRFGLDMKSGLSTSICPVTRHESAGTVDQAGRIYKCNSMLGHPDLATGHVQDAEYNEQHYRFLHLDVFNQCPQDCTYMPMCSGGCRLSSFLDHQNYKTPTCHKPYLNKMAPQLVIQEYHKKMNSKMVPA